MALANRKPLHEARPQNWRAVAVLDGHVEALLLLGSSYGEVRDKCQATWSALKDDVRERTTDIVLERWEGAPDRGWWVTLATVPLPEGRLQRAA
jgi:hypothetical protein